MKIIDKPKFNMAIYADKKQVHVQVIGFIREEMVSEYVEDLMYTGSKINKAEYTFVVDATHQSPLPSKVAANLGETMMVYMTFGYKNVYVIYPKSKIAYVQVRNATEGVNFPGTLVFHPSEIK